ncbi:helix-turn-helix domain-containing protein [Pseudochrobactrum asaccharolyticum]|uniref:helix-turn-helix domain-containing protein n=1 Tax=Pseudochrobactrum asaccharolyticum TaxID=354351 RepID=UPI000DE8C75A|nr:helix-turn-helix domain-containing protein [Pseudochrobactrum asaccharolyticum]MBX8802011.1 helix-turn-helix domain-containing protein [Ochrobactrum sp. MR28]MBX8817705.1 helix-turn-helix domain-containing protein [Ochrobactrum sp. MR31]
MKLRKTGRRSEPTIQDTYLKFTELLVREHGLSLNFLNSASTNKVRTRKHPTSTYELTDLLNAQQAASVLGLSFKTLANWRVSGNHSLKYIKIGGAIRYQYSDLIAFSDINKRSNTSQKQSKRG